jgi:hypothetical protein
MATPPPEPGSTEPPPGPPGLMSFGLGIRTLSSSAARATRSSAVTAPDSLAGVQMSTSQPLRSASSARVTPSPLTYASSPTGTAVPARSSQVSGGLKKVIL